MGEQERSDEGTFPLSSCLKKGVILQTLICLRIAKTGLVKQSEDSVRFKEAGK